MCNALFRGKWVVSLRMDGSSYRGEVHLYACLPKAHVGVERTVVSGSKLEGRTGKVAARSDYASNCADQRVLVPLDITETLQRQWVRIK